LQPQQRKWLRRLIPVAKVAMIVVLCLFIYRAFIEGNQTLGAHTWHADPVWLVVAGVLYLLGVLPAAIFWKWVLAHGDQEVHYGETVRAYYISQLGKYVPGKWMVILLRRMLLGGELAAFAAVLLMGVPTVPSCFQWLLRTLGVTRLNPTVVAKFTHMGWRTMTVAWALIAVGWLFQGASLWATLRAMDATRGGPLDDLSLHTSAVALGVVAGFVSQIPGGLVVREWVAGELLEPVYGPSVALVSTIIYRLMLLVSELSISIILYLAGWRKPRKSSAVADAEYTLTAHG
jgi:glycosyltransferase 2 family protein